MTIKLCLIIMAYHFFSFRLFLTGHQVSNCPRCRFSPSAFRKQLTGHSGQTGRDFVFIFSLGHLLMTPTKMGKTNINLTSVTFHLYLAPQMLPSFSRRHTSTDNLIRMNFEKLYVLCILFISTHYLVQFIREVLQSMVGKL